MQVKILAEEWVTDYNSKRPQETLGSIMRIYHIFKTV